MRKLVSVLLVLSLLATGICLTASAEAMMLTGTVEGFHRFGNAILSLTPEDVRAAGIELGDTVTAEIGGQTYDMLVANGFDGLRPGELVFYVSEQEVMLAVCYSSFAVLSGIGVLTDEENYTWAENVQQPLTVTIVSKGKQEKPADGYTLGSLLLLNFSEEQFMKYYNFINSTFTYMRVQGYTDSKETLPAQLDIRNVVYYNTLNDMMNALDAGTIDAALVNESVGGYIVSMNDNLLLSGCISEIPADDAFAASLYDAITDEFCFMLREDNEDLRDRMNRALEEMTADGTLGKLVEDYITNVNLQDVKAVVFPRFDGEPTVVVAVTGDLPPMDYVNADGTPAGFNTAVLSELAARMHINIELIQVDNSSRALALSSGMADVIFWVRNHNYLYNIATDERIAGAQDLSGLQTLTLSSLNEIQNAEFIFSVVASDIPERLILTKPYYTDPVVILGRK